MDFIVPVRSELKYGNQEANYNLTGNRVDFNGACHGSEEREIIYSAQFEVD